MSIYITCTLFALILLQGCRATKQSINPVVLRPSVDRMSNLEGISKEAAVTIANEDVLKDYNSLNAFKIVVCEQSIFWRVIYDGGGPEYVIDKSSGRIIKKQKLPQGSTETESRNGSDTRTKEISEQDAIAIARRDAYQKYDDKIDLDQFLVRACEQSNVWRIIFDYRLQPGERVQDLPNANFPKYVIEKTTGEILYREIN